MIWLMKTTFKLFIVFLIAFAAYLYVKYDTTPADAAKSVTKTTKTIEKNVKQTTKMASQDIKKAKKEFNGVKAGYQFCSDKHGISHPIDFIDCMIEGNP